MNKYKKLSADECQELYNGINLLLKELTSAKENFIDEADYRLEYLIKRIDILTILKPKIQKNSIYIKG